MWKHRIVFPQNQTYALIQSIEDEGVREVRVHYVLYFNLRQKILNSPDYQNMSISNDTLSSIKLINFQSKVICNKIFGICACSITTFLMSIHIDKHPISLTYFTHTALWLI
ncbi:hypothetical protein QOT17_024987 [Balamuthia mandrillaris]